MTKKAHFLENDEKLFFGRSRCDFHQTGWNFAQLSYFIFPLNETRNRLAIVHGCSALGVLGMVLRCKTPFHPPGQADTIIGHKCGYCYLKEHQKWGRTPKFHFIWLQSCWERCERLINHRKTSFNTEKSQIASFSTRLQPNELKIYFSTLFLMLFRMQKTASFYTVWLKL